MNFTFVVELLCYSSSREIDSIDMIENSIFTQNSIQQ